MAAKSHTVSASEFRQMDHTPQAGTPFLTMPERQCPRDSYSRGHKRIKIFDKGKNFGTISDCSDPFSIPDLLESLAHGKFGSVTPEIAALIDRRTQVLNPLLKIYEPLSCQKGNSAIQSNEAGISSSNLLVEFNQEVSTSMNQQVDSLKFQDFIDLEGDCAASDVFASDDCKPLWKSSAEEVAEHAGPSNFMGHSKTLHMPSSFKNHNNEPVVILDSDEEDGRNAKMDQVSAVGAIWKPSYQYEEVVLKKSYEENQINQLVVRGEEEHIAAREEGDSETTKRGMYIGVQNDVNKEGNIHQSETKDDGLTDIWKEMALALECSKEDTAEVPNVGHSGDEGEEDECEHSFVLKDDIGYVCRVCGVIRRGIDTIFDFQWVKGSRSSRTYMHESRNNKNEDQMEGLQFSGLNMRELDLSVADISVHPRHMKQMKPHQIEGFKFLVRNLITDTPGGCILAHAPGSGKTFMIISFIQSFLAKYPQARPLVVLPKGILGTWKKEFQRWQVEDIPLFDFYASKAENRYQQLEVLKNWVENRSILFLGYKQFSNIVCGTEVNKTTRSCQDILLKVPRILILDEGHTPRNENTDVLHSLAKVQTPCKVVLSGTLYQNHVKEVFNILNLVRPRFLKLEASRAVVRRVLSRVQLPDGRKQLKTGADSVFFDLVENTLQKDTDFKRKVMVIRELREMTSKVLHYYKGDFLDELPGLLDLTVLLNLSTKQKKAIEKIKKLEKFKRSSIGSAIYIHPQLKDLSENAASEVRASTVNDEKIDDLLKEIAVKDGVKMKFFLNILGLCESSGEKLLVFSQYLLPLKFLERLVVNTKGWSPGKEIFAISGDTSPEQREYSMEHFNNSPDAKVFFGSIKACGEGISLVGASRILILDVHLNPSVTRQAIGRAFRPGQERKVHTYRLIAADSPEEEDHNACFRKELISRMWFEWSECCGGQDFEIEKINLKDSGDLFLESPLLSEDVKVLYRR